MTTTDDIFVSLEEFKVVGETTTFVTYVRPVFLEDAPKAYGVYSEEGIQLALFDTEEAAYYAARLNHLEPVLIH